MNPSKIILLIIILLGLFFRIYKLEIFYPWGHDQDLFAWIAKDIVVDHHFRLIGQETSITGIFIGPIFYYLMSLSFAIFNMNPLSASIPTTIISLLTIFSIYHIFTKNFGKNVGFIGAFLYAVSPGVIFLDRWVVPTQPTILWTIWYLYILLSALSGNMQILVPLSILIGLIWHIHIAFIPLLILLPVAFVLSDKKTRRLRFSLKTIVVSLLILIIFTAPLFLFEIRHGFVQTKSLITATYQDRGDLSGTDRLLKVINSGGRSLAGAFVLSNTAIELNQILTTTLPFLLLAGIFYLWSGKVLTKNQAILILTWVLVVFLAQFFSKRIITEYYFNNLFVILFLAMALVLNQLNNAFSKFPLIVIFLATYLLAVMTWFIGRPDDLGGFLYKRQAVEYIKSDASSKSYPCIAINHIESQRGGGTGFRYLFWLNNLSVITSDNDVSVYSIVNPWTISASEVSGRFGNLGVIIPSEKKIDPEICFQSDRQLLPLWGFNN